MNNALLRVMSGDSNKSEGKINVTLKCSGLKLNYQYSGPKGRSADKATENCTLEFENFEIGGECEATMSGFFKLVCGMKDSLSTAKVDTSTDKESKYSTTQADKVYFDSKETEPSLNIEYLDKLFMKKNQTMSIDSWPVRFSILNTSDAISAIDVYNGNIDEKLSSSKLVVVFACKKLYNFNSDIIIKEFLYGNDKDSKTVRTIKDMMVCYGDSNDEIEFDLITGSGDYKYTMVIFK